MSTNRKILIDNATLSGVERVTGLSQIINLNYLDNDILCLEKLVTSILFSDELIGIDDYKEKYRSSRLKNFDFINFFNINKPDYEALSKNATAFAQSFSVSLADSKPTGDILTFFETLKIDPQLRWDIWVSSEYLTLSYLVNNQDMVRYETSIDSAFRHEQADQNSISSVSEVQPLISPLTKSEVMSVKDLIQALANGNPNYAGTDGKSALSRILFGYGWAAERSHFYNEFAAAKNANVSLAPLRDAFCESCYRIDYPSQTINLVEELKKKSSDTLSTILEPSGGAKFAMRLPFFCAYLISETDNPKQCIEKAYSMRSLKEFQDCRTIFSNLDHLSPSEKRQEINGILKYLEQSCNKLMSKYAISTANGLQFSISLGITGINFNVSQKLEQLVRHHKNKPFSRVFRNIAQDMLNVERLGALYDKMCSSVRKHQDATYPKISTTPKFMESKANEYGRPAVP